MSVPDHPHPLPPANSPELLQPSTHEPEPTPMIDVHPPHHAATTWRDFFIHIATIVIGLLIAIGLEQTVERIHHSHERSELRETLHRESEQILKDSRETAAALKYHQDWL